jgi:hypothetical protein
MKTFLMLTFFFAISSARAQTPAPQVERQVEQKAETTPAKPDPKLHADVVKLVEISGARKRLEDGFASMAEEGKKEMMKQCPQCSPEFGEEWTKRMQTRLKPDDFLEVFVKAYEKNFSDSEILELIGLQEKKGDAPPSVSPQLQEKIKAVMPALMGEIMGGCAQIGAKIGGEVGEEIEKEHPEWVKNKPQEKQ